MTVFQVWAPNGARVELALGNPKRAMVAGEGGWWRLCLPDVGHGVDYGFAVDGGKARPDPRSRWQPNGVHGLSRTYDHRRFEWSDGQWRGIAFPGSVVYEMHIGTFTPDGTFDAAISRLDHLTQLGVDIVEVMPVGAFPGQHGWGYDGVDIYAVHEPYGGPDAFKRFVDACHSRGLGVYLDVVYNHVGPSGNYLAEFGPYFTGKHNTPWGPAVNLDDAGADEVRRWIVDNAVMWLHDYHLDGLRLDAVHALVDTSAVNVLEQLAREVDALATGLGRPLSIVAESDLNDPRLVTPWESGGFGLTAHWNDDFHHCLHCALTGERHGYYSDFGSLAGLAKTLAKAYFHDGTWSSFRGRSHGRRVDLMRTPAHRFQVSLQNHDQIGNRAAGDRISGSLSPGLLRIGAALLLTAPFTPMLFMGEEWAASTPWQFFTDHPEPDLAEAVRSGRLAEFTDHGWVADAVPDPQDPATYRRSQLDWSEPESGSHAAMLSWYRDLIELRGSRAEITDPWLTGIRVSYDEEERWLAIGRGSLRVVCNFAGVRRTIALGGTAEEILLASDKSCAFVEDRVTLPGESVAILAMR